MAAPAKKTQMKKWTEKNDDRSDKKMGIKENSKRDKKLDKKRGLAPDSPKAKTLKVVKPKVQKTGAGAA